MEENLDRWAVECAQRIVKGVDKNNMKTLYNLSTKTLGVLQEQGIYAMVLFLFSRTGDEKGIAKNMCPSLYEVLRKIPNFKGDIPNEGMEHSETLEKYCKMTEELDQLLLIRTLYERTLIYTRYSAKAAQKESENEGER